MPLVIGLSGFAGSGKDTAAFILRDEYGFAILAFADKLRDFAKILNPYFLPANKTYNELVDEIGYEKAKRQFPCVREFLINLGEGGRQTLGKSIWIDALRIPEDKDSAIRDMRYRNETKKATVVWRIDRPGVEAAHETEAQSIAQIEPDYIIKNDGTIKDFKVKVIRLISDMLVHGAENGYVPGGKRGMGIIY